MAQPQGTNSLNLLFSSLDRQLVPRPGSFLMSARTASPASGPKAGSWEENARCWHRGCKLATPRLILAHDMF